MKCKRWIVRPSNRLVFPAESDGKCRNRGATQFFLEQFKDAENKKIGVIAGRGNNGGDGFVIARYLAQKGISVTVYLLSERQKVSGDAAANLELLPPLKVPVIEMPDAESFSAHETAMRHEAIWIDAILGTGLQSDVKGFFKDVIDFVNQLNKPVFAVDIPSGLNSDTGRPAAPVSEPMPPQPLPLPKPAT